MILFNIFSETRLIKRLIELEVKEVESEKDKNTGKMRITKSFDHYMAILHNVQELNVHG
jgi:hypothetical protein